MLLLLRFPRPCSGTEERKPGDPRWQVGRGRSGRTPLEFGRGKVCVCELVPLFDLSPPTVSHHQKKLRDAGIVDCEGEGLSAYYYYYYVKPECWRDTSGSTSAGGVTAQRSPRSRGPDHRP